MAKSLAIRSIMFPTICLLTTGGSAALSAAEPTDKTAAAPEVKQLSSTAASVDPNDQNFSPAALMDGWPTAENWQLTSEELIVNRLTVDPIHADQANITVSSTKTGTLFSLKQSEFYGGNLTGTIALHPSSNDIALSLSFANLYLTHLLATFGSTSSSQGTLNGSCTLIIPNGDYLQSRGEANIRLEGGQLLANATVADVLLLNFLSSPGRDSGSVRLEIGGGRIRLRDAHLANDQLALAIRGHITLTGELDLRIDPEMKSEPISKVPLLGQAFNAMIGATTSHMARLRVTGDVSSPKISIRPF